MTFEQLSIFEGKGDFRSTDFERGFDKDILVRLGDSVSKAFGEFLTFPITKFGNTARSNMLNDLVVYHIASTCMDKRFRFYDKKSSGNRNYAILDEKYVLFFKKSPVSNVKTHQDDLIKSQGLGKHIIFMAYEVDDYWSSISRLELQYFTSPGVITYSYDITEYVSEVTVEGLGMNKSITQIALSEEKEMATPKVEIKKKVIPIQRSE